LQNQGEYPSLKISSEPETSISDDQSSSVERGAYESLQSGSLSKAVSIAATN
ncbi:MAG: hypothetical protein EZS28_049073, partial [Streblomastix strix]